MEAPARKVAVVPDDAGELKAWAAELVDRARSEGEPPRDASMSSVSSRGLERFGCVVCSCEGAEDLAAGVALEAAADLLVGFALSQ